MTYKIKKKVLVTGCAGFIGFHLCQRLLNSKQYNVYGLDNLNSYYDIKLKKDRLRILKKNKKFNFFKINITKKTELKKNFDKCKYDVVINLAAQAGVRHSIEYPETYVENNIIGFFNILEASKNINLKHLIFASTSSVYGSSNSFPLKETENTDAPLSFYAATKKTNEVLAYSYANIFKLPCTGLRFFTVYGNYGRPDMALFKFTKLILAGKKIDLFNKGEHHRDFTHVDDIVDGIFKLIKRPSRKKIPFDLYNIGSDKPEYLKNFVKLIENNLLKKAKVRYKSLQLGDVVKTHASIAKLKKATGYKPSISVKVGIKKFTDWYLSYYK